LGGHLERGGNFFVDLTGVRILQHLVPVEVAKACRWAFLDLRRGVDEVDNAKKSPHNILSSFLALLRRDKLQVVLEQLLELCDNVIDAGEDDHD